MTDSKTSKILRANKGNLAVVGIVEDVNLYAALEAISTQEGGKALIAQCTKDVLGSVEALTGGFKSLSHPELIALCASLKANLDMLRTLTRSSKNKDLAMQALEDAVAE